MFNNRNIPRKMNWDNPQDTPQDTPKVITHEYHRLSLLAYQSLERQLDRPQVTNTTTDIAAGYKLGVQEVLRVLREGFVVGT